MKKCMYLFLIVALLFGLFPMTVQALDTKDSLANSEYGYSLLSEDEKLAYIMIESCIKNCDESVEFDYDWGISTSQLKRIVEMFTADHPQYFWFSGSYSYGYYGNVVLAFYPNYIIGGKNVSKTEIAAAITEFESATNLVLNQMEREAASDDYSKAVWLHDKVAQLVSYEFGPNHQTAYGALVEGKAVCAGYARLYQHFLKCAGISAWLVRGTSVNPATNSAERHAWTLLWLDGKCVYSDVTWNDQGEDIYHVYFARSLNEFSFDHIPDPDYSGVLPECNCDDYGYFDYYSPANKTTSSISSDLVSDLLVPNGDGRSWTAVLFDPSAVDVINWLQSSREIWDVTQDLGYGSYSLSTQNMGDMNLGLEIHLTIINHDLPTGVTVSGTVTSFLDNADVLSLQLLQNGATVSETVISGNSASYSFTGVMSGEYILRVTKDNHVTKEISITIDSSSVTADVKLCPIGDITGDGKVNMKDWSALYAHINEVSALSGYAFSCADVTGDGKLNMKDWNRLYGHVSETNPLW